MSEAIRHHPREETLAAYVTGTLPAGAALVIRAHLGFCPACRAVVRGFEAVAGALLEGEAMADLPADLFERTLALLDAPEPPPPAPPSTPALERGIRLPPALADVGIGPWRWSGPGLKIAKLDLAGGDGTTLMLMKIAAGQAMPQHGHNGLELTLVLEGAYRDAGGRFGPGDLADEDEDSDHQPVVEPGGDCLCLVAVRGKLKLSGIARFVQPFLGL